jgi:hypothetical protein
MLIDFNKEMLKNLYYEQFGERSYNGLPVALTELSKFVKQI